MNRTPSVEALVRQQLTPAAVFGSEVCAVCKSWREAATDLCNNCQEITGILGRLWSVEVVSLYSKPSDLRDWLTQYKPNDEEDHPEYAAMLQVFLDQYLETGALQRVWADYVVVVPSTRRSPPHPLTAVIAGVMAERLPDSQIVECLQRTEEPLSHRLPNPRGFVATAEMARMRQGASVLIVDDVYTTGARAQSAAYVMDASGFDVRGVLVLGRRINPEFSPEARRLWETQRAVGQGLRGEQGFRTRGQSRPGGRG